MKIFTFDPAPNPMRLNLFLRYKGLQLPSEQIDLMSKQQLTAGFLAINPRGTVPVLQLDDGRCLSDVIAICAYLDALYPDKPLLGEDDFHHAQIIGLCHRIFMDGLTAVAEVLRNGDKRFTDRAMPGVLPLPQIPALVERGQQRLQAFFESAETWLGADAFLLGASPSQADIDLYVVCEFSKWIDREPAASFGQLTQWRQAMAEALA